MLKVKTTEHNMGITISGDYQDLSGLYESMQHLTGYEDEYGDYDAVHLRMMSFAYDIRHAFMGTREVLLEENGVHQEMKKWHGRLMANENVYYSVNILWIEAMFVVLAMEDYITMVSDYKKFKKKPSDWPEEIVNEQRTKLLYDIAVIRLFGATVWTELRNVVGENRYKRIYKSAVSDNTFYKNVEYRGFCTQMLDELNTKYLDVKEDKRPTELASALRKIIDKNQEYYSLERDIKAYAREQNISYADVRLSNVEYPEDIEW